MTPPGSKSEAGGRVGKAVWLSREEMTGDTNKHDFMCPPHTPLRSDRPLLSPGPDVHGSNTSELCFLGHRLTDGQIQHMGLQGRTCRLDTHGP